MSLPPNILNSWGVVRLEGGREGEQDKVVAGGGLEGYVLQSWTD